MTQPVGRLAPLHLWLNPVDSEARSVASLVETLAAQVGAPVYKPHVTVAGPIETAGDETENVLQQLQRHLPISLTFSRVELSDGAWQRGFYLLADRAPDIDALVEDAQELFRVPTRPFPHMSLMYSDAPLHQCRALAATVQLELPLRMQFDRLELWQTPLSVSGIRDWAPLPLRTASGRRSDTSKGQGRTA